MTTALESVRVALIANGTVAAALATKIYPKQAAPGAQLPYAELDTTHTTVWNTLQGWGGMDRCEVELQVWALTFTQAAAVALSCRRALEAAGFLILDQAENIVDNDASPPEFSSGWIVQAFQ